LLRNSTYYQSYGDKSPLIIMAHCVYTAGFSACMYTLHIEQMTWKPLFSFQLTISVNRLFCKSLVLVVILEASILVREFTI